MAHPMRSSHLFLLLGIILIAIAFVARSGLFTRINPGEPANKYMRAVMTASKTPQLSAEEAAVIAEKYKTAMVKSSGLRDLIQAPGLGETKPQIGQEVTVSYVGRLLRDGTKFDSSYDHGQPRTVIADGLIAPRLPLLPVTPPLSQVSLGESLLLGNS